MRMLGNPIEIDGEYASQELPPPLKGQRTVEILNERGYNSSKIQELIAQEIVYTPPTTESRRK